MLDSKHYVPGITDVKEEEFFFSHKDHGSYKCVQSKLVKNFNLDESLVSDLIYKRVKEYSGWSLGLPLKNINKYNGEINE